MRAGLPSERDVLLGIYEMYEPAFPGKTPGENDPLIAIDVTAVAAKLGCKPHLLFGFLYYYLEHKYRYKTGENTYVNLFVVQAGNMRHVVNFPYLAAILSAHDHDRSRYVWTLGVSIVALVLSISAIIAQLVTSK